MPTNTMTEREVSEHAHAYAQETAGAIYSVSQAYARHYVAITRSERDVFYWPPHKNEFWRWIKYQSIKDWRQ
jgi:hypothetical protein